MKKRVSKDINPAELALLVAIILSVTAFLATVILLVDSNDITVTPLLKIFYGGLGYNVSLVGAFLGAIYIGIDAFLLTWIFVWLYNKLL